MPWVPDVNNMSGFEIAGIIVSAIPIVTRVVNHFGSPRNAPRQVERLSRMLAELQDERFSQAAMPTEQKHIHDMVNRCTDILERETTSQKGRVWKFFWSAEAEKLLKEHNDELERELDRLLRRVQMYPSPVLRDLSSTPPSAVSSPPEAPGTRQVRTPSPYLEPKGFGRPPSLLSAQASPDFAFQSARRDSRRPSVGELNLPTTLCLQNPYGQRIGEKLKLQTFTILERDDTWRRIEYVGRAGGVDVRVTHRIPRGKIWFEDEDMDDRSVSFLEPHDITVQNAEGYKVYRAYSLYEFSTVEHREQFLVHARERQLLGRYFADKIWDKGELVAQQKVVRLWKKTASREPQRTTLAFIGRDEKPYERPLVDFRRSPTLRGDKVELVDLGGGGKMTLEFRAPPKQKPPKKWKLGSSKSKGSTPPTTPEGGTTASDAALFKAAFEANHPSTSTWAPLTLSPTGFEPPDFKDFTPRVSMPSPLLPELVPSTSRAPTLSTISVPSATFSFIPDAMDLPASPKTRSTMSDKDIG